ncbi:hypothetical protein FQN60_002258, partial [Etheostoma spectabile]
MSSDQSPPGRVEDKWPNSLITSAAPVGVGQQENRGGQSGETGLWFLPLSSFPSGFVALPPFLPSSPGARQRKHGLEEGKEEGKSIFFNTPFILFIPKDSDTNRKKEKDHPASRNQ